MTPEAMPLREQVTVAGIDFWYRLVADPEQYQHGYTWYTLLNILNYAELGSVGEYTNAKDTWSLWVAQQIDVEEVFLSREAAIEWLVTRYAVMFYIHESTPHPQGR